MNKWYFFLMFPLLFTSCGLWDDEDEGEVSYTQIATVENPNQVSNFYFVLDNSDRMLIASSSVSAFKPATGQRILAYYSIIQKNDSSKTYTCKVKLKDAYKVLTKKIVKLTAHNKDSIGNDKIILNNIWVGSHYLNVEFGYYGYNKVHAVNLVTDSTKKYTDQRVHLEFRHNANSDSPQFTSWGIVSFDLSDLKAHASGDSVALTIHTNEYNGNSTQAYKLSWKLKTNELALSPCLTRAFRQFNAHVGLKE